MTTAEHISATERELVKTINAVVLASYELSLADAAKKRNPEASKLHYENFKKYRSEALDLVQGAINLMESS
jgi:hypothetical protein